MFTKKAGTILRFILLQVSEMLSLISLRYIVCLFILKRYNKMQLGMFSDEVCVLA